MKPSRLASVAVLGVLLAGGLAACRADPAVAAYVDGTKITEAEVDAVVTSIDETLSAELDEGLGQLRASLDEQVRQDAEFGEDDADAQYDEVVADQRSALAEQLSVLRNRVVEMRIITEAAHRYAEREGLEVPAADPQLHAEDVGLAADHPYVAVVAEFRTVLFVLQETIEPVEPTEADQREVYDNLVAQQPTDVPFAEARAVLTGEVLGQPVAIRDLLREIIDGAEVTVNPRYDLTYRVPVSLGGGAESWLGVPLGDPAVVDPA